LQEAPKKKQRLETGSQPTSQEGDTIFVGNLPYTADEDAIKAHFGDCGEVVSVRIGECHASGNDAAAVCIGTWEHYCGRRLPC
jgi:hypothetical protein